MKRLILLSLALTLNGCAPYVGIAMHDQELSRPEIDMHNPIGIIGGSHKAGRFEFFIEHHSGITYNEKGKGYNLAGVKYHLLDN